MKLLYYKCLKFQPKSLALLKRNFEIISLNNPGKDTKKLLESIEISFAPLGFFFNREKIDSMPKLKIIASNTTGYPHIDVDYAKTKGIKVITLKGENKFLDTITPTAELTWGLIIALTRHLIPASRFVLGGKWDRRPFGGQTMLSRLTLGVVGLGRLGKMVAEYGKAFRMKVIYYDPFVKSADPELLKMSNLKSLASKADIITVHVPAEKENTGLVGKYVFDKMKKGSYFVNTSRAELVDHRALLQALRSGHLAGAALDVFTGEFERDINQKLKKHPLLDYAKRHSNLLITPHIGGSTQDAWLETELFTIKRIMESFKK
ncbi:MAG: D-isomer specific 2-hydroxyacid dehydrogenase family protein [Candidatus Paceibacterota bacterium]|jgi:D-3-phosphoglycerate dehydrogenase